MNANELADWLDNTTDSEDWGELAKYYKWCKENVAPMLRQQQAEIEALKDIMVVAIKSGDWVVDGACDPDQYIGDRL